MKRISAFIYLFLIYFSGFSQEKTLSLDEFLSAVSQYHPIAKQANLFDDRARLNKRMALGGFDPKLSADKERKIFDGITYYDYLNTEVKLPLWYGVDLKASYSEYEGAYLNPESKLPKQGLSYLGISVPIGSGLFIDQRRAALQSARIYQSLAKNERQSILNDLFLNATSAYTQWASAYENVIVYQNALALAKERFVGTKSLFINGDKPAIDTLEALILVQNREFKLNEYRQDVINTKNQLSSFLWLPDNLPVDANKLQMKPVSAVLELGATDNVLKSNPLLVSQQNTEVLAYNFKLQELEIERKLKLEDIKPNLNFNVGILNRGKNPFIDINANAFDDRQKFGFTFSMPLTFTKQRASYSLTKLKIKEANLLLNDKQNTVVNKWNSYLNDYYTYDKQINLYQLTLENNKKLLAGEEVKFKFGDSSLFLLNSREQKVLETQEKIIELKAKRLKSIQMLKYLSNGF